MKVTDHKTIIGNLTPEQRVWFLARSDYTGLRQLTVHLAAIAFCTGLIMLEIPFFAPVLGLQGILIVFLFTPLHETVHQTPFRSKYLNLWVGRFCGFFVFLGPEWFRFFHLAHHRYTHQREKDPELSTPKPITLWQYLKYLSGLPDIANRIRTLIRNAVFTNRDEFVPARGKSKVRREARIQIALYFGLIGLSILANSTALIMIWILPILLGGPFLRAYLLAEHARCPHVSSALENTRTTLTNAFVRFVAWNMPYHVEHHAYPSVPFHKLPDFHNHIKAHIIHKQPGYFRFNQDYLVDSWAQKLEQ